MQVVLPQAARETRTPRADFEVTDTLGMQQLSMFVTTVPPEAVAPFHEEHYTAAQLTAFWGSADHPPFGEDLDGNALWPVYDELVAHLGLAGPGREEGVPTADAEGSMFSAGESAELLADLVVGEWAGPRRPHS